MVEEMVEQILQLSELQMELLTQVVEVVAVLEILLKRVVMEEKV